MSDALVQAAKRMGVSSQRVLDAISRVDRRDFVPDDQQNAADVDMPVPIARNQTTSQPSLIAAMVEALELHGDEHVLEIGTGLGYQTALLAHLADHVTSVERFEELADAARANLSDSGIDNVDVVATDGTLGWPEAAPYDAIVVSAAASDVPRPLVEQLRVGGRLVQPVGSGGAEQVTLFRKSETGLERERTLTAARFVRLVGEHGLRDPDL